MDDRPKIRIPRALLRLALGGHHQALAEIHRQAAEQSILARRRPELTEAPAIIHTPRIPTNRTKKGRRQRRKLAAAHMGRS